MTANRDSIDAACVEFETVERVLNQQFQDAIVLGQTERRYDYFLLGTRDGAAHRMAVFCIADTLEPLRSTPKEELRIAVPIAKADATLPASVLGASGAHYFYLTYAKRYGSTRTIRVDDGSYNRLFKKRRNPPVKDFLRKLGEYTIVPLRLRDQDEYGVSPDDITNL